MDKDRIVKRTQMKRSDYKICGMLEEDEANGGNKQQAPTVQLIGNENRSVKNYDAEIFDDQDFYNQLLRELIDRKSSSVSDPVQLSKNSIELQRLRLKTKKQVDTKASKGRKIKFETHKPLVNFMAPLYRQTMSDEARLVAAQRFFDNQICI